MKQLPTRTFRSREAWERWLAKNHASSPGLWMKIAKKASGIESVTHAEALEAALCYGWIDGQRNRLDERYFLQKFTPRTRRSTWSRVNREKAEALVDAGRMQPAGLQEMERAKADGRWEAAYEPQSTARVPADLCRELAADPKAKEFFESLDSRNRYAILFRLQTAKRPETRAGRLTEFMKMLKEERKLY